MQLGRNRVFELSYGRAARAEGDAEGSRAGGRRHQRGRGCIHQPRRGGSGRPRRFRKDERLGSRALVKPRVGGHREKLRGRDVGGENCVKYCAGKPLPGAPRATLPGLPG